MEANGYSRLAEEHTAALSAELGSQPNGRRKTHRPLTEEEALEVQRLICEGMSATQARAKVLREGLSP